MTAKPMTLRFPAAALAGAACAAAAAALPAAAADARALLQGYWEPPLTLQQNILQPPQLTDKGKAAAAAKLVALDTKDGVPIGSRYCLPLPQPWNLMQSAPISIVQDARETMMMYEAHSVPSHIYTDGRDHSGAAAVKPQVNGHSIGRWEGDTFVVDTVRFFDSAASPGGWFPGNVPRGPASHLVSRFTPAPDGKTMDAIFTVDDPDYLVKPYSWAFHWKRSDAGTYAASSACDPADLANSVH